MSTELYDKVAVVTGAASDIGLALCARFLAERMRIVMADVEEARLVAEADRLAGSGDVVAVPIDVADPDAVRALADATLDRYEAVHLVCNNAGVAPAGPMLVTQPRNWQWTVGVNLLGVAYGVAAFAPILVAQGGHIVNTASEAGLVTSATIGMYCATKHAMVGLSESLCRELDGSGVGVSVLSPSVVAMRFAPCPPPGDELAHVRQSEGVERIVQVLHFLECDPQECWDELFAERRRGSKRVGSPSSPCRRRSSPRTMAPTTTPTSSAERRRDVDDVLGCHATAHLVGGG